jgi:hypothetical protein
VVAMKKWILVGLVSLGNLAFANDWTYEWDPTLRGLSAYLEGYFRGFVEAVSKPDKLVIVGFDPSITPAINPMQFMVKDPALQQDLQNAVGRRQPVIIKYKQSVWGNIYNTITLSFQAPGRIVTAIELASNDPPSASYVQAGSFRKKMAQEAQQQQGQPGGRTSWNANRVVTGQGRIVGITEPSFWANSHIVVVSGGYVFPMQLGETSLFDFAYAAMNGNIPVQIWRTQEDVASPPIVWKLATLNPAVANAADR